MNADLHCHSKASDGRLAPAAVVRRAVAHGVQLLALTDHDTLDGLAEARAAARDAGIGFLDGVEVSVTWRGVTVHVVGLAIAPAQADLVAGLGALRAGRRRRAARIAEALAQEGIAGSLEGARRYAHNPEMIGRTHFARHLVASRVVKDMTSAFRAWLGEGRPGCVPHAWATLEDALAWIHAAGGRAIVAHPGRYGLSGEAMRALLEAFRDAGGHGIEVVTGAHSRGQMREFATLARHYGLAASRGSDFHAVGEGTELGRLPPLDPGLRPAWAGLAS